MERRPLPQSARHAVEPLNAHGTGPTTGLYTADQAAAVVTALVSQIHTAAAELAGLAEHLLALQEHRYADRS
ncbi:MULTISPECIES: hypothetical protein [unclassified Streptomyces]|uniref:hypothetical protein n=1 Tax=unclassified Streptomyces TaxID=2593676 RepID=UPI0029B9C0E5|nr:MULTISPECIES: hypothetical protein [unclassified Streptomyces]MDX3772405.1 hypothetical protein [Streptomyces sp. AK08-01B]MDX3821913.1 hypothetical protein [Streptomyces sp. AK08-01A]